MLFIIAYEITQWDVLLKVPRTFPSSLAPTESHSFTAMLPATFLAVTQVIHLFLDIFSKLQ